MLNPTSELEIDIFKLKKKPLYLFQQYRNIPWLHKFFLLIDRKIQEKYYSKLQEIWSARDILRTKSPYITFYARYYLGLIRPIKSNPSDESTEDPTDQTRHLYDIGIKYDTRWIYDDYYQANPFISNAMFRAYLRFCLDYSQETWTHDYIVKFAAEWCEQDPVDVKIVFTPTKVIYYLLATTSAREFIASHNNDEYDMNMPFFDCYEFRLGDHTRNPNSLNDLMLGYKPPTTWEPTIPPDVEIGAP
ncbi:TPA: hypothetical protein RTG57_001722 [Campylobacter jejuni]|nr:hypothetical protein [Campylobacter jejuni]